MTDSEDIQNSVLELAKAHWDFLEQFLEDISALSSLPPQLSHSEIELIRYGFLLAFPHGYKHGLKDTESKINKCLKCGEHGEEE